MTQIEKLLQETAVSSQSIQQIQHGVKTTLAEVMGDSSPEMLDEMSSIFLEDALPLIDQIKSGYLSQNFDSIKMAAHALKGSSATIGLITFAEICQQVENSSKANQLDGLDGQIAAMEIEYSQIKTALTAFLL